ncbi:vacuolar protein sorting-associated protein 8 homolog [Salvelinus sp. IW2-2015]|uniref:vacuolar protein sorting-associated protein 8 homolog n=1 Tax=Salvelinus sp. IW2-2015 TaxID=2691554 RepID=UPI000CEACED7|nr:vacuolar protein sorting-associated protein 8 homolog [Salvelinus alpinus]
MVEILFQYVERSVKKCPEHGKIQVMEQHFQDMVPVMVDYCLLLQRTDLLFNHAIYPPGGELCGSGDLPGELEPYPCRSVWAVTAPVMRDC